MSAASLDLGAVDVLGHVIPSDRARQLGATDEGRRELSADRGAVRVTSRLVNLGLDAFYLGNFDSSGDLTNSSTQIPSSFTCGA